VAAAMPSTAPHHRRKAQGNFNVPGTNGGGGGGWQWQGCGPSQCYRQDYGQCFHATSYECTNPIEFVAATPPPTQRLVTPRIQTEIPILFQLLNVDGEYMFSSSDRTKFLSKIRALLDEELDDSWEIISVESLGEYSARRLTLTTSSLRGGNTRRLNKTLYIQVVVTLRGREDMSDMARLFILQALRSKLNTLLIYIKSINANAFRSLQLSVNELNLADVVEVEAGRPTPTPTVGIQSTSTNTETIRLTETKTSVEAPSTGTPFWVWLIVATVCIPLGICLLLCMCRAGWCLCCTDCGGGGCFKRKRDTREDYERQIQSVTESRRQYYARRRQYYARRTRSDGIGKYGERGRGDNGRRRHGERRRGIGKWRRTRSDSNIIYYQSDRPRPSRSMSMPMAKRSLSMKMDKEIALAEMNIIEGGIEAEIKQDEPVVAALPLPASFPTQNRGKDTPAPVEYENALVIYGDEQIGLTLEPEGPKIENLPKPGSNALSLVTFNPPKDPEGELCTAETPRRRSLREL